ncbi:pentapeptide repeat-containing protein [Saccharothrix syringae]|uniref:Pentapeptide repeat-containing protein n=1 Tax=Saccharothrix syringae TaxID=103733 RepID=A0A5Q0H943_SACSY|nr:pentapeptide repeat-containing protein [Saccharothrix syringae]QFZ22445.1 pentapeptide repeat-containing protein [Saccharothrix syringae]
MSGTEPHPTEPHPTDLRADCSRCFGLCCVVPAFARSSDFAIDKPARTPCPNLGADSRCGIHARLRDRGFTGCTVYDCFGAGQQVSRVTFGGVDWRDDPASAGAMFDVFPVVRRLHELQWYLTATLALAPARPVHAEAERLRAELAGLAGGTPRELLALDLDPHWGRVNELLLRASGLVRGKGRDRRGADLVGKDLRGAGMRAHGLRGAYLIGANLAGADLRLVDFTGADLRGADLSGADLTGAFYLTQAQLDSARGDRSTRLPAGLAHPAHWGGAPARQEARREAPPRGVTASRGRPAARRPGRPRR